MSLLIGLPEDDPAEGSPEGEEGEGAAAGPPGGAPRHFYHRHLWTQLALLTLYLSLAHNL
jgi:hypothetical protein